MTRYGVDLIGGVYYEVDAENEDEAVAFAFDMLYSEATGALAWDCNDVAELTITDSA